VRAGSQGGPDTCPVPRVSSPDNTGPVARPDSDSGPLPRPDSSPGAGVLDPPPPPGLRPIHAADEVTPPAIDVQDLLQGDKRS
jgi:hypothetical protein